MSLNPIQDEHFWGCSLMGSGGGKLPLPKICHIHPTMMKLGIVTPYLKKIQKYLNHVTHTLSSAEISIFDIKFCYIKYRQRLYFDRQLILVTFVKFLKIYFNKHAYNFEQKTAFCNKNYDVIITVHYVPKKLLSCNSNFIVDVNM